MPTPPWSRSTMARRQLGTCTPTCRLGGKCITLYHVRMFVSYAHTHSYMHTHTHTCTHAHTHHICTQTQHTAEKSPSHLAKSMDNATQKLPKKQQKRLTATEKESLLTLLEEELNYSKKQSRSRIKAFQRETDQLARTQVCMLTSSCYVHMHALIVCA